jgi:hypothetical protein
MSHDPVTDREINWPQWLAERPAEIAAWLAEHDSPKRRRLWEKSWASSVHGQIPLAEHLKQIEVEGSFDPCDPPPVAYDPI